MIKEDYVSFEVAKLLREKGFNEKTEHELWYVTKQFSTGCHWNSCAYKIGDITREYDEKYCIAMPTLQMACKWLREVHNIFIAINVSWAEGDMRNPMSWRCEIIDTKTTKRDYNNFIHRPTYEEEVEAAIKYVLENLI